MKNRFEEIPPNSGEGGDVPKGGEVGGENEESDPERAAREIREKEKEYFALISGADSLSDLMEIITDKQIKLVGSEGKIYDPSDLVQVVEKIRAGETGFLRTATRSGGFRDKVRELIDKEDLKRKRRF